MGFKKQIPFLLSGASSVYRYSNAHSKRFVFIGRNDPVKGLSLLLDAYKQFRLQHGDYELLVIGLEEHEVFKVSSDKNDGVTCLGYLDSSEVANTLMGGGFGVVPSLSEQWGVVIHEFCMSGLPVIATKECGATDDLVIDGSNGRVVDAGSVNQLIDAMTYLAGLDECVISSFKERSAQLGARYSTDLSVASLLSCARKS